MGRPLKQAEGVLDVAELAFPLLKVGAAPGKDVFVGVTVWPAERLVCRGPQVPQHDRHRIPRIGERPHLRLRSRQSGLRRRRPGIPRRMLTQLVQQDQITRKTARTATRRRRHPILGDQFLRLRIRPHNEPLRMPELHIVDQLFQLRFQAGHLHRLSPRLLRVRQILGGTDHRARLQRIHMPQRQHDHQERLAILACHQHDHRAEPVRHPSRAIRRQQLQGVDE